VAAVDFLLVSGLIVMVGSGAYYWLHYSRPDRRH
jgi:hypothetical protein